MKETKERSEKVRNLENTHSHCSSLLPPGQGQVSQTEHV